MSCAWSTLFFTPAIPLTISLKQFIPDPTRLNPIRKKKELFDASDTTFDSAYDFDV